MRSSSPTASPVVLALVLVCFVPWSDQAAPGAAGESNHATVHGQSGMRVALDPETGTLGMPSPDDQKVLDAELDEMLSRSTDGLRREVLPDGTVRVNLQGRFQSASVATIDAQGRLHTGCVDHAAAAQAVADGTAPAGSVRCNHENPCSALEVQ
jgi:hypothetical protein